MNAENPDFLLGYHTKLLDGNCIEASEHRIEVLRTTKSAALPGKSLVVFDPQTELAMNIFPCEDGHAQERLLLNKVSDTIEEKDLWVADRNFCTQDFLFNIAIAIIYRLWNFSTHPSEKFIVINNYFYRRIESC
ncbi:MAG: hypothetical protein IPL99_21535 [Candidatus Competibacteraceae bacterium]|nr:hypothetical protein [Candidatus Competibacteraceae bacterium]